MFYIHRPIGPQRAWHLPGIHKYLQNESKKKIIYPLMELRSHTQKSQAHLTQHVRTYVCVHVLSEFPRAHLG